MDFNWEIIIPLAILSIVVIFFNSLGIYVIIKTPTLRHHSILAIANLLLVHLIQGTIVIPFYIVKRLNIKDASISGPACSLFRFSYMITNYVACITLLLISVDRLCAVKWPLIYKSTMKNRKMKLAILGIWIYVLILCLLPFIWGVKAGKSCVYRPTKEWSIAMLAINTFVPLLLICACYVAIFQTARKSNTAASGARQAKIALRIAKVSAVVVSAFLVCWGPSFMYYMLVSTCSSCFSSGFKDSRIEKDLTFMMKFFTFLDGVLAPLIYCLMHRGIRDGILVAAKPLTDCFHCTCKGEEEDECETLHLNQIQE